MNRWRKGKGPHNGIGRAGWEWRANDRVGAVPEGGCGLEGEAIERTSRCTNLMKSSQTAAEELQRVDCNEHCVLRCPTDCNTISSPQSQSGSGPPVCSAQ